VSMDDAVTLTQADRLALADILADVNGTVLLAVDDIDGGVKLKVSGRWTPAYGTLTQRDPGRSSADDLAHEARVIRPAWWGSRQDDRPDPGEYVDVNL
jgi:hypothetical protein